MSVVINTNYTATIASNNLAMSNANLQRSITRLSSGSKIVNPSDDAGGLAVSMKLSAAARRQGAVASNIGNAVSLLQTQDGALKVAGKVLERISELRTLYSDVTKSSSDLANYDAEFTALTTQLRDTAGESFNGVSLFGSSDVGTVAVAHLTARVREVGHGDDEPGGGDLPGQRLVAPPRQRVPVGNEHEGIGPDPHPPLRPVHRGQERAAPLSVVVGDLLALHVSDGIGSCGLGVRCGRGRGRWFGRSGGCGESRRLGGAGRRLGFRASVPSAVDVAAARHRPRAQGERRSEAGQPTGGAEVAVGTGRHVDLSTPVRPRSRRVGKGRSGTGGHGDLVQVLVDGAAAVLVVRRG